MQLARNVAVVRLTEIEAAWHEATNQSTLTDQRYHTAGLAAVKAQGPGSSRGSMSTAHNALTEAERVNMEAKALVNQLGHERDQLKFRVEFLDMRIGQLQDAPVWQR